jgi:hypothetical protein
MKERPNEDKREKEKDRSKWRNQGATAYHTYHTVTSATATHLDLLVSRASPISVHPSSVIVAEHNCPLGQHATMVSGSSRARQQAKKKRDP